MYREVCGQAFYSNGEGIDPAALFCDDDVIHEHKFICPMTMLRLAKLTLFIRIMHKSPEVILAMMGATEGGSDKVARVSWVDSVKNDFKWLAVGDVEFFGPTSSMNIGNIIQIYLIYRYHPTFVLIQVST